MSMTGMLAAVAKAAATEASEVQETVQEQVGEPAESGQPVETVEEPPASDESTKKAVLAERSRVLGIAAAAFPGQEKLALSLIETGASLGEAALAFNADHKAKSTKIMANLDADEAALKGLRSEPANGADAPKKPPASLQGESLWKSEYAVSQDLQAEFGSEDNYLAYKRADARGGIRVMSKRTA